MGFLSRLSGAGLTRRAVTQAERFGNEIVAQHASEGQTAVIEVEDNGPFFTTRGVGHSTGLGISHRIVEARHKGQLSVDSEPGRTTFTIRLPLNLGAPA